MTSSPSDLPKTFCEKHFKTIFFSVLTGAVFLYCGLNPAYKTGFYNDDAVYVMVARDLWNRSASHLYPVIRPDFPLPGLPLVLAPLAHLVDPHWTLLDWVTVAMTLLSVGLLGLWARKWMSAGESLAVMGLYAFNPIVARFSGIIVPSPYYTVAVLGSFLLMHSLLEAPTVGKALGLGFLLGWGSVVRPEGMLLLVSVMGPLVMVRRQKDFVRLMGIPLGLWGIFVWAWFRVRPIQGSEYGGDLSALVSYWFHHFLSGVQYAGVILRYFLVDGLAAIHLTPGALAWSISLMIAAPIVGGFIYGFHGLWRKRMVVQPELLSVGIFCGLYLLIHLFWHVAEPRYFIPLIPFVIAFSLRGFNECMQRWKQRQFLAAAMLLALIVTYAHDNGYAVYRSLHSPDPMNAPPRQSLRWLRANTEPTTKVLSLIGANVALYSRRPAVCVVKAERFETFRYRMRHQHLKYIVDRPMPMIYIGVASVNNPNTIWNRIRQWVELYPQRFQMVFHDPLERTTIYEYIPDPGFIPAFEKYQKAARAYDMEHLEEAYVIAQEALDRYPKLGSAINLQGVVDTRRGRLEQAEEHFLRASRLRPDSLLPLFNLAAVSFLRGDSVRAEEYLIKAKNIAIAYNQNDTYRGMKSRLRPWSDTECTLFTDSAVSLGAHASAREASSR